MKGFLQKQCFCSALQVVSYSPWLFRSLCFAVFFFFSWPMKESTTNFWFQIETWVLWGDSQSHLSRHLEAGGSLTFSGYAELRDEFQDCFSHRAEHLSQIIKNNKWDETEFCYIPGLEARNPKAVLLAQIQVFWGLPNRLGEIFLLISSSFRRLPTLLLLFVETLLNHCLPLTEAACNCIPS